MDFLRRKPRRNADAMLAPIVQRTLREPQMKPTLVGVSLGAFGGY
jgi:hypothetical protein